MVAEQRRMAAHVPASPGVEAGAKPMIIALQLGWWIVVGGWWSSQMVSTNQQRGSDMIGV